MQIRPTVKTFDISWNYEEPLSVHVVETGEDIILFGTGTADAGPDVADVATDHDVNAVVVEHGDPDHFAGVPAVREALESVEVAAPAADLSFLEEADIDADVGLEVGDMYHGIEVIAAPGHTPDNMAYRSGDVLIAGDTVVGSDSRFTSATWSGPLGVIDAEYNADDGQARESAANLRDVEVDVVLVTHGSHVVEDGRVVLETLAADLA